MEYKGLEKYKALQEARKAKAKEKKKEKKKIDKAKEREKKKAETHKNMLKRKREKYKPIHIKNLRKKQNARAYQKRRKEELKEHASKGDVHGYYRIIIAKDYEQIKELSASWWLLTAYDKFKNYIKENNDNVICQKKIIQSNIDKNKPVLYEILLLKKIDPENDNGKREIRNEYGLFVENSISNSDKYAIIDKAEWYIPETYNVYGYNPTTDRKTGRWIFDNIINKDCSKYNIKNTFLCDNKIVVEYTGDIDLIICKNSNEAIRLYNAFESNTDKKNKYIIYSGFIADHRRSWIYDRIQEKTGWRREMITKKEG